MATKKKSSSMSAAHKAALAEGRSQGRAVRKYLEALEANKPKRGRKRNAKSIQDRIANIDASLAGSDPLKRVQLIQERRSEEHKSELQSLMRNSFAVLCLKKKTYTQ